MTSDLKPCPFCGHTPDINLPSTFQEINGCKWGAVVCCCTGPEVRTGYKKWHYWKQDAINEWNERIEVQSLTEACREAETIHMSSRSGHSLHGDAYDLGPVYSTHSETGRERIKELGDASVRLVAACESKQNRIVVLEAALDDKGHGCDNEGRCNRCGCRVVIEEDKNETWSTDLVRRVAVLETENTRMNKDGWLGYKATLVKANRIKELEGCITGWQQVVQELIDHGHLGCPVYNVTSKRCGECVRCRARGALKEVKK